MNPVFNHKKRYFKVIKNDMRHYNHTYKEGLNILLDEFNSDPKDSCVPGGFYFSDLQNISNFFTLGHKVWEVKIPQDAQVVRDLGDLVKWRTDKIRLKRRLDKTAFLSKLPKHLKGNLDLRCTSLLSNTVLPKSIEGDLNLSGCIIPKGLVLPKRIGGQLIIIGSSLPDNLVLPESVESYVELANTYIPKSIQFPKRCGSLTFVDCYFEGSVVLPEIIYEDLQIISSVLKKGSVLPKRVKGKIYLYRSPLAKDIVLPKHNKERLVITDYY